MVRRHAVSLALVVTLLSAGAVVAAATLTLVVAAPVAAQTVPVPQPLPTLPPLPGDRMAPTITAAPALGTEAARIDPIFPRLSMYGFAVAALIVLFQVLLTNPRRRGHRTL